MAQSDDTTVAKVLSYIVFDWLTKHMDINCHADAVDVPQGPKPIFLYQRLPPPPLQFKSTEVIQKRHYSLELEKEPYFYWMKELNVKWLPQLDVANAKTTPPEVFPTILTNVVAPHATGFYRVVTEVSEEYECLVRLQITRL